MIVNNVFEVEDLELAQKIVELGNNWDLQDKEIGIVVDGVIIGRIQLDGWWATELIKDAAEEKIKETGKTTKTEEQTRGKTINE